MSLSLSSLLNPSDDSKPAPPSASSSQNDSHAEFGANTYVRADQPHLASPTSGRFAQLHIQPPTTAHEAAQALAALSASPGTASSQWSGNGAFDQQQNERRLSHERRPGSSYSEAIQLPPPPPQGIASRKMSSPTLEQYQVASRSPEQRRASMILPPQSNITLAPLQGFANSVADHPPPASYTTSNEQRQAPAHGSAPYSSVSNTIPTPVSAAESASALGISMSAGSTASLGLPKTDEEGRLSPAVIKQEKLPTPQPSSPTDARRTSDTDYQASKAVSSLKTEHGARTHSPLRESSIPLPTIETAQRDLAPPPTKKRAASAKTKKGTATTMKRAPPAKKRKVESMRSATPLSHASAAIGKGTPGNSSPAPSTRSQSVDANEEAFDDDDDDDDDEDMDDPDADVYCICRKPDNGTFMIGCDGTCDDWFHGKCVGIEERDKNLIDKYICPNCTQANIGRTTWKRMCRRHGCRQPARVGKTKNGNSGSKYCSEECGVLFFRELAGRARGREQAAKNRSSRRKGSINHAEQPRIDDDLGARGGVLAAGEVKALLNATKTAKEFHSLGDGVLSPPATPDGKDNSGDAATNSGSEFSAAEQQALAQIHSRKEHARHRHVLLKDRMKFVTMVKQLASRTATEKELKPKEYCGYDSRLEWSEEQFERWRNSKAGKLAFELESLSVEPGTDGPRPTDAMDVDGRHGNNDDDENGNAYDDDEDYDICERKKCARHLEWSKLAVDDLRFEMSDNGDRMRALDKDEREIRERAALRARGSEMAGEGTVEVHEPAHVEPAASTRAVEVAT